MSGAERVGGRVDAASDLAYRTFTNPVVKALAVGTGTRRAVQRLKGDAAGAEAEGILMFKRATWLGVGFTLGAGTTVVAARKARQQLDRYKPPPSSTASPPPSPPRPPPSKTKSS